MQYEGEGEKRRGTKKIEGKKVQMKICELKEWLGTEGAPQKKI